MRLLWLSSRGARPLGSVVDSEAVGAAVNRSQPDDGVVFVSDEGELPTGWIHVDRSFTIQTEPFAKVGGLVVDLENRGDGIGRRSLEIAEQWASAGNHTTISERSNVVRSNAHLTYDRRGYSVEKEPYPLIKDLGALSRPMSGSSRPNPPSAARSGDSAPRRTPWGAP